MRRVDRENEITKGKKKSGEKLYWKPKSQSLQEEGSSIASNFTEQIKRLHCAYQLEGASIHFCGL